MARILVVDDEQSVCWALEGLLREEGHAVTAVATAEEALEVLGVPPLPDLLLTDVRLPGLGGLELLQRVRSLHPGLPVVVMTAYGTLETAVAAMKGGAVDHLTKPLDADEVLRVVATALLAGRPSGEVQELRRAVRDLVHLDTLVGNSPAMLNLYKRIGTVAGSDVSVLIEGESGTGKEMVARAIHASSARAEGPFLAVNCASIPEALLESELYGHERGAFTGAVRRKLGKVELAHEGTLFLDEVAEIPPAIQVKLLRFLEERRICRVGGSEEIPIDVRVIAATNRKLTEAIREGSFREDLYYRLAVVPIELAPLRERREDIPLLVAYFLERAALRSGVRVEVDRSTLDLLQRYAWPGNVRELRNAVEHAVVMARGSTILPGHLPPHVRGGDATRPGAGGHAPGLASSDLPRSGPAPRGEAATSDDTLARMVRDLLGAWRRGGGPADAGSGNLLGSLLARVEAAAIAAALEETGGNLVHAARLLGVTRTTLRKKGRELGLLPGRPDSG